MNSDKPLRNENLAPTESGNPAEHEATVELIEQLRTWSKAYPENVFGPVTEQETKEHASLITRNSAAMGRHCGQFMAQAADALEAAESRLTNMRARMKWLDFHWLAEFDRREHAEKALSKISRNTHEARMTNSRDVEDWKDEIADIREIAIAGLHGELSGHALKTTSEPNEK